MPKTATRYFRPVTGVSDRIFAKGTRISKRRHCQSHGIFPPNLLNSRVSLCAYPDHYHRLAHILLHHSYHFPNSSICYPLFSLLSFTCHTYSHFMGPTIKISKCSSCHCCLPRESAHVMLGCALLRILPHDLGISKSHLGIGKPAHPLATPCAQTTPRYSVTLRPDRRSSSQG